jgi:hypothetical protein
MPRGGARSVSGPPPDPNALRRNRAADLAGWTTLPRQVPYQPPPEWPLIVPNPREIEFWLDLWQKPQSVMWRQYDQAIEVAFFVRKMCEAELPKASVELRKSIRQDLDSLGLSVQGMLRNKWKIEDELSSGPLPSEPSATPRKSARSRLKVVDPDE